MGNPDEMFIHYGTVFIQWLYHGGCVEGYTPAEECEKHLEGDKINITQNIVVGVGDYDYEMVFEVRRVRKIK